MYDEHYGLTGRPFQLTPDPKFWFDTATHKKAMAYLGYGLSQGEGFIVITGEPGAGKTTLVGHVMSTIDPERLNVIRIVTTQIEADDLLRIVAQGLGAEAQGLNKAQLLGAIERGLHAVARTGRRTLLIIDEAQSLPPSSVEELRMLSNFQAGGHSLLQIFLLGQPEFRELLHGTDRLEQLRQRVIATHHLDPMEPHEVEAYIAHRLSVVGWQGRPDFTDDALEALYHGSGGLPRRLNQIASRLLLFGAIEQIETFTGEDVAVVLEDMAAESKPAASADHAASYRPVRRGEDATIAPQPADGALAERMDAQEARIASLESRLEEQDKALRRVLTLLVDWVEGDRSRPDIASVRDVAAA
ncbi:XrtA/PEP-CTERM system-associated ATPase [Stakelama saccharophila]|uniref:XrtA-associated ATPase n=1 Tax=Stakelama saccharophila TaxID=3075605 RepID=A0ABZ0B5Z4_9SPHN|nr:XrtA/PEP-CTERM system-associated ATPase [Stakelama sp. W311]WNO52798.1 XrtA-associated ATPase [Stakelama sp. W311]